MVEIAPALPAFLIFVTAILLLAWLSRNISLVVQSLVHQLTGSLQLPIVIYFLLLLPGILVHESAHWIIARILGLRPGKFRVWPQTRGKIVALGSVTIRSGGIWLDSLVGLAPLLFGTVLTAVVSRQLMSGVQLTQLTTANDLGPWIASLWGALRQNDSPLWVYLLFTIANGMMPSAPDREPVKPVILYLGLALFFYIVLGMPLAPLTALVRGLAGPLMSINSGLIIIVALDVAILAILWVLLIAISQMRTGR